jgi:hypothetical protein
MIPVVFIDVRGTNHGEEALQSSSIPACEWSEDSTRPSAASAEASHSHGAMSWTHAVCS